MDHEPIPPDVPRRMPRAPAGAQPSPFVRIEEQPEDRATVDEIFRIRATIA